jgi:YHS domain-containing protein
MCQSLTNDCLITVIGIEAFRFRQRPATARKTPRPGEDPTTTIPKETTMTRSLLKSVLAGAMLLGVATAAFAATGEYDNMCTMGLALGKDIKTDCSINATLQGKMYCFGNEEAKTMFMKDPAGNLAKAQAYYSSKKQ